MKVSNITAVDTFSHGRLTMKRGDTAKIEAGEARELEKAGLVSIEGDEQEEDLIGGEKMAPITSNKMEKPVSNKSTK